MDSNQKVALITGSTKGIGFGIAENFIQQGIRVVITSRTLEQAQQAASELSAKYGVDSIGLAYNIESSDTGSGLVEQIINRFGRLDILVNNALSQNCLGPLSHLSDEQISQALNTNITNTLLLSNWCYPHLKTHQGSIVNITSVIVNKHLLGLPLYGIIKGAIVQMTKVLAAEWANDKIRVNAINPGFIRTQAFEEIESENVNKSYEFYKSYCPIGDIGNPADVAGLVSYMVSEQARFMTGSVVEIDGGYSIQGHALYSE